MITQGELKNLSWTAVVMGLGGRVPQDAVAIAEFNDGIVFSIADGVGGKPRGEIAAELAARNAVEFAVNHNVESLVAAVEEAQAELVECARSDPSSRNMATTLTVVRVTEAIVQIAHVGDCRVYHLRGNGLAQLTEDQTELQRLIANGVLSRGMAARYRRKNVIWSSLGPESTFETFESEAKLMPSDRLLMITDGLYSHFSKEQIRDFSLMSRSPLELVERLSVGIEKIGPSDDYSLVAISLEAGN